MLTFAAMFLSVGCSVSTPPRIAVMQAPLAAPSRLALDPAGPADAIEAAQYGAFRQAIEAALAAHGVVIDPASTTRLSVAVAVRPAAVGITQSDNWLSKPRRHHFYDSCRARRIEAVLVLRDAVSGAVTAQWRGGFDSCRVEAPEMEALAEHFARALTGR
jgi:hypothetical protein